MNPRLVDAHRGSHIESFHGGSIAVCDDTGRLLCGLGGVATAVYPRSTAKPLQALPLIVSGAVERFCISSREIAVACGSHCGDGPHTEAVMSMLNKAGHSTDSLECGSHWPLDEIAARRLTQRGQDPSAVHNNCSGKHAGFICVAEARHIDPRGYVRFDHPVMQEVRAVLEAMCSWPCGRSTVGIDGCSIPTFPMPLVSLATGFSRLGTGGHIPAELATAAKAVRESTAAYPDMLSGSGRFDSIVTALSGGSIIVKSGAEGTICSTVPAVGLGIAIKIDDGGSRAAHVVMATMLMKVADHARLNATVRTVLTDFAHPLIFNWAGIPVGRLQPTAELKNLRVAI